MKKTLLFAFGLIGFASISQTITVNDTLSAMDKMYYYACDTSAASYPAVTGAGVTWDYSNLAMTDNSGSVLDTIIYRADSPFSADYPDADYHDLFNDGVQSFFTNFEDSTVVYGFVFQSFGTEIVIKYDSDPLVSLKYPMNQGDSYTDDIEGTSELPIFGSVNFSGNATITADGSGTLILGSNTYNNVIRVKTVENLSGSFGLGSIDVVRSSYQYYSSAVSNFPIFIHGEIDSEITGVGNSNLKIVFSKDMLGGFVSNEEMEIPNTFSVYPNPANNNITVLTNGNASEITILNALGQEVFSFSKPNTEQIIDISSLEKGLYIVQVKSGNTIETTKLVVE